MSRLTLVISILVLSATAISAQQPPQKEASPYASVPADAAKQANPVKPSPDSLDHGKKWGNIDCAMCRGKNGNGKGDMAADMKLKIVDFTDPNTLKDRTDGEIFYIIKNGNQDMPPEGPRLKPEENWDLVNYVRSLSTAKPTTAQKQ